MSKMTLDAKLDVIRKLHDVHQRQDVIVDEGLLVQMQHDVEELLSAAALLLTRGQ